MKKVTCDELGGPASCTEAFTGETAEEVVGKAWQHMGAAHPELAENIKNNPKEVNEKWQEEFRAKFEALPEA